MSNFLKMVLKFVGLASKGTDHSLN